MTYFHPAWLAHQRKRFTRPDAYRFAPPGTPESKPPGWLDPSATRVRWKEAQEEEARTREVARQEEFERELLRLHCEVKKLKLDHELVGLDLGRARDAVAGTVSYLRSTLGEEAWQQGMNPDIQPGELFDNPYQYTDWDSKYAVWKRD